MVGFLPELNKQANKQKSLTLQAEVNQMNARI